MSSVSKLFLGFLLNCTNFLILLGLRVTRIFFCVMQVMEGCCVFEM
jgi:hypothetical protein